MYKHLLLPLVLVLALTACQTTATVQSQPTTIPATQAEPTLAPYEDTPSPTGIPSTITPTPIRPDLTPAQMAALAALSQDKGIPIDQIQLVSTEAVTWNNGCLGIVFPGKMCTEGLVEGFKIVLSSADTQYEYHTNQDGTNVLLAESPIVRLAVRLADNSIKIVPIDFLTNPNVTPSELAFNPRGGAVGDTVYALSLNPSSVVSLGTNVTTPLEFIKNPNYTLAVWPGSPDRPPSIAWGTQLDLQTNQTSLMVSATDGSQLDTLVSDTIPSGEPLYQLVAQRWSADGNSLYFSKEPFGIGGRILFDGATSLYRFDLTTRQVSEIIPIVFQQSPFICLDALSADYKMVVDHCTTGVITVRNLESNQTSTVTPPSDAFDKNLIGSARFSPDGTHLAFAGAKGDYDAEQGWLAVSNSLGGDSTLIATSDVNQYYSVLGWLDDTTLLVQANIVKCDTSQCPNQIWTISSDGSTKTQVAEGTFITFVDGVIP